MKIYKNKALGLLPAAALLGCLIPTYAQAQATTKTCAVAPASVQNFSVESTLALNNLLTTITPNVPPSILAALAAGAQEIRSRLIYNPTANTLTATIFLVAPGSPNPTPIFMNIDQGTLQIFTIQVDKVYTSCAPTPSVLFVGVINSNRSGPNIGGGGPYGSFLGAPAAVSVGYTTDTPPKITNVVAVIAGQIVAFSPSANGSLTFPPVAVTPPGTSGAPVIVIVPTPTSSTNPIQIFQNPYHLDATMTSDPNNSALTFQWTSNPPVNFSPSANVAAPNVQFPSEGDYAITLTVTNAAGLSSTRTIFLELVRR